MAERTEAETVFLDGCLDSWKGHGRLFVDTALNQRFEAVARERLDQAPETRVKQALAQFRADGDAGKLALVVQQTYGEALQATPASAEPAGERARR